MAKVVHFEIHCDDPQRALKFYQTLFGWQAQQYGDMEYWLLNTGPENEPGIGGALTKRNGPIEHGHPNAFVCTVAVDSLDESLSTALANGGTLAMEKMAVTGVGWLAYVLDPEDNIFGMMQNDPTAK